MSKSKFEEYKKATGGRNPIGLVVPYGYPEGVDEIGGPDAVYSECIKRKITWEELLDIPTPPEDAMI